MIRPLLGKLHKQLCLFLKEEARLILLTAALLAAAVCLPAHAKLSDETAVDYIVDLKNSTKLVRGFTANINLIRQDERFLHDLFTDAGTGYSKSSISCFLDYYSDERSCMLYAQREGIDYQIFRLSAASVAYEGLKMIRNVEKKPNAREDTLNTPEPEPTPVDTAEASPSPSPSPTDAPVGFSNIWIKDFSASSGNQINGHPLNFIYPYSLQTFNAKNKYFVKSSKLAFLGHPCCLIRVDNPSSPYQTQMWIDKKTKTVLCVENVSKADNTKITATYLSYYPKDPKTGYYLYERVKVELNDMPLYIAELTDATINPVRDKKAKQREEEETREGQRSFFNSRVISEGIKPFLTENMTKLVIVLCIFLLVLFMRFVHFRISRQEFSDQLLMIDEEDGRYIEMMNKLGYKVTPFTAEALTHEREILGKGITKDTASRPKVLIVAPDCFAHVKNYMFLIKAYIDDGGRVFVMQQTQQKAASMPVKAEFMPLPSTGVNFSFDLNLFTSLRDDSVHRLVTAFASRESYLKLDSKKPAKELISATNKATKIKGTVVGMFRRRKGEIIVCQLRFEPATTTKSKPMQLLLNDIMRFVLGLEPLPREEEAFKD
ncbi:MAG: hypothetical protein K6G50_02050 [bacterium]|nr:hypothetical protein [bacterium]